MISPACVRMVPPVPPARFIFAIPKSSIFTRSPPARSIGHEKQVLWLQITVHDSGGVGRYQADPAWRAISMACASKTALSVSVSAATPLRETPSGCRARLGCHSSVEDFNDVAMTDGTGGRASLRKRGQFRVRASACAEP